MEHECVVDQCIKAGCSKITNRPWPPTGALVPVCSVYIKPIIFWNRGSCPIIYRNKPVEELKQRVGQQKTKRKRG